jgi:DNA-binding transcriptional regulator YiaG
MPRAKTAKTDVTEELVASLEQAVAILDGTMAPGRVHHVDRADVDVQAARQRLGMTQPIFAATFGVSCCG